MVQKKLQPNPKPLKTPLTRMIEASQDYYISQSQIKLNKITKNYTDLVTLVTTHTFPEDQLQNFTASFDFQNRAALKAHTAFMANIFKITQSITSNEDTNTQIHTNTPKYVNGSDLAEPCSQLTEDCGHEQMLDFLNAFDVWFTAAFQ